MLDHGEDTSIEGGHLIFLMKQTLHLSMNKGGEDCVGSWGSYGPRGLTPGFFSENTYLNVATKKSGEEYVGPWVSYLPRGGTPGFFSGEHLLVRETWYNGDTHHGVTVE